MDQKEQKLVLGCLLHDFGKLLYRYNDGRNHSTSGYEFLKETDGLRDETEILNCVRYHHAGKIKNASIAKNDIAYIAYIADNIASAADRRKKENDDGTGGFVRDSSLETIFNVINGNKDNMVYEPVISEVKGGINYPTEGKISYGEQFYAEVCDNIKSLLSQLCFTDTYVDSLLQVLEANLTFIPSSTNMGELRDISLYDHLKLTAALALCIKQYLDEKNIDDYKSVLFDNADVFYKEKAFRIYSLDMSGIQSFIYNISSKGALKGLRARSFYLEMLMESSVDDLLTRTGLCRANVLYTGGGHTYILLPATDRAADAIVQFEEELNDWFIENFGTELYAAGGYYDCSSENLQNKPEGSYKEIFANIGKLISEKKINRYTPEKVIYLNNRDKGRHTRECIICRRPDRLDENDVCSICSGLNKLSGMVVDRDAGFFVITKEQILGDNIILPFGRYLSSCNADEMTYVMKQDGYIRAYTKNIPYTGKDIASNLWIGDYASSGDFGSLVRSSQGIKRLGVIRADVDNLGKTFVNGFTGPYETITRTSVFSRKLSMFFKLHINNLLKKGTFYLDDEHPKGPRNAAIVYAGGDDLFVVGAWDDIIGFAVDLHDSLKKFGQNQISISAGIGMYPDKYPISAMAEESGRLETTSKEYDNGTKDAVTLFADGDMKDGRYANTYHWDEFIGSVIGEKFKAIKEFFDNEAERGKSLLYKILQLIRLRKEENKLNIARFTYLLARLAPENNKENADKVDRYNAFASNMYRWIRNENDSKQLITAIYLYVYLNRITEDK